MDTYSRVTATVSWAKSRWKYGILFSTIETRLPPELFDKTLVTEFDARKFRRRPSWFRFFVNFWFLFLHSREWAGGAKEK